MQIKHLSIDPISFFYSFIAKLSSPFQKICKNYRKNVLLFICLATDNILLKVAIQLNGKVNVL